MFSLSILTILACTILPSIANLSPFKKPFPYGVSSFKQIVADNAFYIDKTHAIQDFENCGRYLKLWRPRRCGKSLVCNQLQLYYDKSNTGSKVKTAFDKIFA